MEINKDSGLPMQIFIPNSQVLQPFEYEFYTNPTIPKSANLVVSYDGKTFSGCLPWSHGVYFYSQFKFSNYGPIYCRATYYAPNPMIEGGVQKVVFDRLPTDFEIVAHGGNYFDPIPDPSKLTIPSFNEPSKTKIPVFMAFQPSMPGKNGKNLGVDKSLYQEYLFDEEYFVSTGDQRRQIYGCRVRVTQNVQQMGSNFYIQILGVLPQAESILNLEGFMILPIGGGKFRTMPISGSSYTWYGTFMCDRDLSEPGWRFNVDKLAVTEPGEPVVLDLFVKYTKING